MRVIWLKHWHPALLVKVYDVPFGWGSAQSWGPVIFIKASQWDNDALIAHEIKHSEDALRRWWIVYAFRYVFFRTFRRRMELRGYAAQANEKVKEGETKAWAVHVCAYYLSRRDDIGWTYDQARAALKNELGWSSEDEDWT